LGAFNQVSYLLFANNAEHHRFLNTRDLFLSGIIQKGCYLLISIKSYENGEIKSLKRKQNKIGGEK